MDFTQFAERQFAERGISAIVLSLPGQGFLNHGPISDTVRDKIKSDACITTVVTLLGFNDLRFSPKALKVELARLHNLCPDIVMVRPDDGWNRCKKLVNIMLETYVSIPLSWPQEDWAWSYSVHKRDKSHLTTAGILATIPEQVAAICDVLQDGVSGKLLVVVDSSWTPHDYNGNVTGDVHCETSPATLLNCLNCTTLPYPLDSFLFV